MPTRLILPLLAIFQILFNVFLVLCLNQSPNLTREEVHSSFVDIAYFENRLQASEYATNFASYLIFWLGLHATPDPDLFYGRIVKAVVMAACAPILYWLLHHRFQQPQLFSLLTSIAVGLTPGIYFYSVLGIDIGLELPLGLLALLVASFGSPWAGALLALSALAYGAGLSFALPVLWLLWQHSRPLRRIALASLAGLAMFLLTIAYIENIQLLLLGGGDTHLPWSISLKSLYGDLIHGAGSYYYALRGHPSLGAFQLGWLSVFAAIYFAIISPNHRPWLLLAASSLAIGVFSGDPPGTRRIIPCVAAATILTSHLLQSLLGRWPRIHLAVGLALLLVLTQDLARVARHWYHGQSGLQQDFRFAGISADPAESLEAYRLKLSPLPTNLEDLRAQFSVIHLLTQPDPVVSFNDVAAVQDPDDPPIPKTAGRFSLTPAILKQRFGSTSSAGK